MSRGRFVYIAGADGTGKSTHARLLLESLRDRGVRCRHLWLRFPFLFSLPLLAYARWRGYSWHEVTEGIDHGYWDFRNSWLMRRVFPWVVVVDAALASIFKVYLPLWLGYAIVCERYVLDMIVDLSLATGWPLASIGTWSQCLLDMLPDNNVTFVLDLDAQTAGERRPCLLLDRCLESKLDAYRDLAERLSLIVLDSRRSRDSLAESIREHVLFLEKNDR